MFNLLVMGGGWSGRRDELSVSRIYVPQNLEGDWREGDLPNFELRIRLPALFAPEVSHDVDQAFARVGEIISVRAPGGTASIEYRYDPDIPPIPMQMLISIAPALGIEMPRRGIGPLEHTHWSIKEGDLFRVLMTEFGKSIRQPTVFELRNPQRVNPNLLSTMMPFAGFDAVWGAIQRAGVANGMECGRADNRWDHPAIMQDVVALIDEAAIVVCDCTGRNANVFYEMGIAHSLGKEVIVITQNAADIPFDIAHLRHIRYLGNDQGLQQLEVELSARIRSIRENA
ncbi:MAG: hypothetical protein ACK4TD_13735 [Ectopseudomonas guguanensis]|uniref:hypothetical protein n=1 Tax=Ectopseudomonas guguanensis TaxID=1198456 RepID=UPI00391B8E2D